MIRTRVTSLRNVVLQEFMNDFGTQTIIAITTAYRIDTLVMWLIVNLGTGIATFTTHSYCTWLIKKQKPKAIDRLPASHYSKNIILYYENVYNELFCHK